MDFHLSIVLVCLLFLSSKQIAASDLELYSENSGSQDIYNEIHHETVYSPNPVVDSQECFRQISEKCLKCDVSMKELSYKIYRLTEVVGTPNTGVDSQEVLLSVPGKGLECDENMKEICYTLDRITYSQELHHHTPEKCLKIDMDMKQISSKLDQIKELADNPNPGVDSQELLSNISEKCLKSGVDMKQISSKLDKIIGGSGNIGNIENIGNISRPGRGPARDCADLFKAGNRRSGIYFIVPEGWNADDGFNVFCDMDTDRGGWTVFQRRGDFGNQVDYFFKTWDEYKTGFGDLNKEFWLGNEQLFALTNQRTQGYGYYEFRADMKDMEDKHIFAKYKEFRVKNETELYELHAQGYSGTAGTCLAWFHKKKFVTKDKLVIGNPENYALKYKGGWWYWAISHHYCNPNGLNVRGQNSLYAEGITWYNSKGHYYSFPVMELKIRPDSF